MPPRKAVASAADDKLEHDAIQLLQRRGYRIVQLGKNDRDRYSSFWQGLGTKDARVTPVVGVKMFAPLDSVLGRAIESSRKQAAKSTAKKPKRSKR